MTEVDWEGVSAENLEEVSESRADRVMKLIDAITTEIREAHKTKYEMEAAERTAALCLEAQRELAEFLADAEILAKESKADVESTESKQYFFYQAASVGKTSDAALKQKTAGDDEVKAAKKKQYKSEADYNKWRNLFGFLKDAHIYFRGVAKGKSEWS